MASAALDQWLAVFGGTSCTVATGATSDAVTNAAQTGKTRAPDDGRMDGMTCNWIVRADALNATPAPGATTVTESGGLEWRVETVDPVAQGVGYVLRCTARVRRGTE